MATTGHNELYVLANKQVHPSSGLVSSWKPAFKLEALSDEAQPDATTESKGHFDKIASGLWLKEMISKDDVSNEMRV